MLIDTHCHLNMIVKEQFNTPITQDEMQRVESIVIEAEQADVCRFITVGTSVVESHNCVQLANYYPHVFASVGLHPTDSTANWRTELAEIKTLLNYQKVVAIGECGFDFYHPNYNAQQQGDVFKAQIELALEKNLALIIHSRDAFDETMKVIEPYKHELKRVVMHCFSENVAAAQEVAALGFMVGISGAVTYPKNNELRSVVSTLGLNQIVLETDAPFLPPQIARGKKNYPKYIAVIAHYIAQHLQVPYDEVVNTTTGNATKLFALPVV